MYMDSRSRRCSLAHYWIPHGGIHFVQGTNYGQNSIKIGTGSGYLDLPGLGNNKKKLLLPERLNVGMR